MTVDSQSATLAYLTSPRVQGVPAAEITTVRTHLSIIVLVGAHEAHAVQARQGVALLRGEPVEQGWSSGHGGLAVPSLRYRLDKSLRHHFAPDSSKNMAF
ncbi:hypothetical protein [Achromobacter xylosoxidans]|uniref:hypothetical protein n=1 Tax=Alcaligenes xylosoxydans xylosoxydans TaxID=85698 RepID=UPI00292D067E|nr:hypothetical protein [Achromobacter xylosoxidans]WOB71232.1 hypothetical protein PZA07_18250 [Achromobacter xylosoxidans]